MATTLDLENWMGNLPSNLHSMPLRQLAIPGSHDSGGFYLDRNSNVAPDESKTIKELVRIFGKCAKNIVYRWGITQSYEISQQLEQGVRYFDLRVAFQNATENYCFVHGLYGKPYPSILNEMKEFLLKHPKEVVILDFNHLWDFTVDDFARFLEIVEKSLTGMFYGPKNHGPNCSLVDLWSAKKQVIALYDDDASTKKNPSFWPRSMIFSPWYDTANVSNLLDHLNSRFDNLKDDCFNVFQAILTPQTSTIFLHLINGNLRTTLAQKCDQKVCAWLQQVHDEKKKGVNIVICDFVNLYNYAEKVIALNYI